MSSLPRAPGVSMATLAHPGGGTAPRPHPRPSNALRTASNPGGGGTPRAEATPRPPETSLASKGQGGAERDAQGHASRCPPQPLCLPQAGSRRLPSTLSATGTELWQHKMEPFYLYDLGFLTENKAIQRILCPMAAQLCHLILALEWEGGICEDFPHLGENAEKLAKATEELASVARRLAEESSDEVFKEETCPAAESLVLAGRCMLLAAHKLQVQPENPSHREELAVSAKRVLTETVKILQMEDAAGARRIIQAASWLLECLSVLRDAGDMPGLLAAFRAFSEALLLLSNLTAKRLEELRDCPRQRRLAQTLQLLQKCVPLLHAAKHSDLKHSWDQQVNLSKGYAFQLTERTIKELTSLLINNTGSEQPWERNGTFSQHVSRLLALLSRPDPVQLSDSEFSAHVEAVIFYCMLLADSSRPDPKLDLVKHCWVLLQLRKSICSHVSQQEGWPGQSWGENSLDEECHTMRKEVETLDQAVLTATLCQILDTFLEGKEPLRQLVEDALSLAGAPKPKPLEKSESG
ncbi:catenin alpha-1-like [Aquila chrysaetos chrysaetos]|uniref:catenin alpha-1-like n=1 Tax=Aquila chrysaetos chrysaetos TaxID=223781 RepID=UPI0011771495|nr:catenin alpha-1-like [Aquila chrysaetos chrysaetos]